MMWNLLVFALVGLLVGAAARVFYPERRLTRVMGTLVLGLVGALAGGVLSWIYWPGVDGQFQSGNLLFAMLGAMIVIALRAGWTYTRSVSMRSRASA